jgi:uncharacterized protein YdhG (YjbR/CyaY superfamily)
MNSEQRHTDINEYIAGFSPEVRKKLTEIRAIIKKAAPEAEEKISYNMPAFAQNGILVYYAAFKNHIGFFPTASPIQIFKEDLKEYKWSKGTIQFPLDRPLPSDLISRIVIFKVNENKEKANAKKHTKKA